MKHLLLVAGLCSFAAALHGNVIFTLGNNPQIDEQNVLLNKGTSGTTVFGSLNQTPSVMVQFSSTQTLLEPANGQARITVDPESTALNNITLSLVGGSFGDVIFNPDITGVVGTPGGTANVIVNSVDSLGNPEAASPFDYILGNGNNFLTITTTGGERLVDVTIAYSLGFTDLRQVRVSGVVAAVPEPSTFVPFIALALGCITRIRKPRKIQPQAR